MVLTVITLILPIIAFSLSFFSSSPYHFRRLHYICICISKCGIRSSGFVIDLYLLTDLEASFFVCFLCRCYCDNLERVFLFYS